MDDQKPNNVAVAQRIALFSKNADGSYFDVPLIYTILEDRSVKGHGIYLEPDETLVRALRRENYLQYFKAADDELIEMPALFRPWEYWRRIARNHSYMMESSPSGVSLLSAQPMKPPRLSADDHRAMINSVRQASTLLDRLEELFHVVEPDEKNLDVYGHEIRNLLIVACTEVEAQLKGVLKTNNCDPHGRNYNMHDYRKVNAALKLDSYELQMPNFVELQPTRPFEAWEDSSAPNQPPLEWYAAYNAIKHDRESKFDEAKLRHAISAVLACVLLIDAQFGEQTIWSPNVMLRVTYSNKPHWPDLLHLAQEDLIHHEYSQDFNDFARLTTPLTKLKEDRILWSPANFNFDDPSHQYLEYQKTEISATP